MALNDISLTAGMRANLLSLQGTVTLLDRTQARLASGKKVNTAMDNPISYFASQSLNARASAIDSLKDAMGQAVQTVTAADKGITALSAMIEQAKGLAQSAQSAEVGPTETEDVSSVSTYQTISLCAGNSASWGAGDTVTITADGNAHVFVHSVGGGAYSVGTGEWNTAAGLQALIAALTEGTFTSTGTATITLVQTANSLTVDMIATAFTDAGIVENNTAVVSAESRSFTVDGTLFAYTAGVDTGYTLTTVNSSGNTIIAGLLQNAITTANVGAVAFAGTTVTVSVASDELVSLEAQYNSLRYQMDELAEDSGYKGKNLLSLDDLVVKFEGTVLTVAGFDASTTGLGVTAATWVIGGDIETDVTSLGTASNTLRSESSKLAGNLSIITVRQSFSTNMINTLNAGSDALTLADTNEEGANMLMLQTRQTLATTALSLSAQAAQSVLRLFQ